MFTRITSQYETALAKAYNKIEDRGLYIDPVKLQKLSEDLTQDSIDTLASLSTKIGLRCYVGKDIGFKDLKQGKLNVNAPKKLLKVLKDLGYKVPLIRKAGTDSEGNSTVEFKESVATISVQKMLANPLTWPAGGAQGSAQELLKELLHFSELKTILSRYVKALLYNSVYYSGYGVASTRTGRRSSTKNIFKLGNNAQNFPKYKKIGKRYRECIVARPGNIFFLVDQKSAEDWPVQALSENYSALEEMRNGVNRHVNFASVIFGVSRDKIIQGRETGDVEAELQYYLGKKSRHANNYGMRAATMSESLAQEAFSIPKAQCQVMLDVVNRIDPNVQKVFHAYVQACITKDRFLRTPLGRERQFFGLREGDKNYSIFNEAFSYIPQSLVGDNTGLGILFLHEAYNGNDYTVNECHDSICQEPPDDLNVLESILFNTNSAFRRIITFHNGISIEIPIEAEIGYSLSKTVKLKDMTVDSLREAYRKLKQTQV